MKHKNIGDSFDSFLEDEGILEEVEEVAIKRVIAFQLKEEMRKKKLSKKHMAEIMKNEGTIIANDIHAHKIDLIKQNADRLGLTNIEYTNHDGTKLKRVHTREFFDKILIDAPCSGIGVLRRNPDSKWKLQPEFVENIKKTQAVILENYSVNGKPRLK